MSTVPLVCGGCNDVVQVGTIGWNFPQHGSPKANAEPVAMEMQSAKMPAAPTSPRSHIVAFLG